jgi:hypothetical protein
MVEHRESPGRVPYLVPSGQLDARPSIFLVKRASVRKAQNSAKSPRGERIEKRFEPGAQTMRLHSWQAANLI